MTSLPNADVPRVVSYRIATTNWSRSRPVLAGAVAAVVSGLPSTMHAIVTRADVLAATSAAGTLIPGRRDQPGVAAGITVHVVVSAWWTTILSGIDRRHELGPVGGAVAGAGIALIDQAIIGRHYPAIRALPQLPQWLDHVLFGVVVGSLLRPARIAPSLCRSSGGRVR